MKKLIVTFLSAFLVLTSLVSCSNTPNITGDNQEEEKIEIKSFDELMEKMTDAQKIMQSYSANMKFNIDVELMGERIDTKMDIDAETDMKKLLSHISANMDISGDNVAIEMYSDMGENAAGYFSQNGEWVKQSFDENYSSQLKGIIEKAQDIEFDYSKYISEASFEEAEFNGKECYKATYSVSLKPFEMLEDMGIGEYLNTVFEHAGLGETEIILAKSLLADLGKAYLVQYVDARSLNLVAAEIDMTEAVKSMADKIIAVVAQYSEADPSEMINLIKINNVSASIVSKDINNVSIVIPDEALEAREISGIIGGADGPTSIITENNEDNIIGYGDDGTKYIFDENGVIIGEEAA